nr:hypothetical protein [Tanacetum cinerariifolium]
MKNVLKDNERLLEKAISVDIVNIVVHDHVNSARKTMNVCERCVTIETELQNEFIKKECYDTLFKKYKSLEKHYDLKAQSKEKDTIIMKLKERLQFLSGTKLMAMTPKNNDKMIRFTEHIPSSENTPVKTTYSTNVVSNTHVLSSTRVNLLSSASGSQPQGNTKKDRIQLTPSKAKKNKLEDHPRIVRPSLNKKKSVVDTKAISYVTNSKSNVNSDLKCATCNGCLFLDNQDLCVLEFINTVNACVKYKSVKKPLNRKFWQPTRKMFTTVGYIWRPTGQTFTLVENVCPLTRITTTAIMPLGEPIPIKK